MQQLNEPAVVFSASLKRLLSAAGKTQIDLAKALNVSQAAVSKWMNGTMPNARKVPEIAAFLNVPVDQLLKSEKRDYPISSESSAGKDMHEATGPENDYEKSNKFERDDVRSALLEVCDAMIALAEKCKKLRKALK